jgi:hypothetical protein
MNARDELLLVDGSDDWPAKADRILAMHAAEVRNAVAADFELLGKRHASLSWGQAVMVVREGLCQCQGGSVPCPAPEAGVR